MSELYNRIYSLCQGRRITITDLCRLSGASRGSLTDLKMGRINTLKAETMKKIADYFEVSVDYLMTGEQQKEKAPAKAEALVNGDAELNEYLEELKNREECRMLFSLAKGATKEDVMRAVAIIEALRREEEGR